MSLSELLTDLSQQKVELWAEGDELRLRAPKGVITAEIRQVIEENKPKLLSLLQKQELKEEELILPTIEPSLADRYQPFPLTDIQYAYWIGRTESFELGNVATHAYLELDCLKINLPRLNWAWQQLIKRHEMMRTVVLENGQQQILQQVPEYQIQLLDLSDQTDEAIQEEIVTLRERMSHQVRPTEQWPLFEIVAIQSTRDSLRLHLSIDILTIDMGSLMSLLQEWSQLYHNPHLLLPPLEISFRDYVLAEQKLKTSSLYQRSRAYWQERITNLPPAPQLPLAINPQDCPQPRFHRRTFQLESSLWQSLKNKGTETGLTASTILLTAFAEILTVWSREPRFTINLTLFNRLPLHPKVNQILGDFTSLNLLEIDHSSFEESFLSRAMRLQQQLWQDLDHRYISGVEVLRELSRHQGATGRGMMPIVFTSALALGSLSHQQAGLSQLGEMVYGISQTPQVWLDHQVIEQDGALLFNWDAIEALFPDSLLDEMFDSYCQLLIKLATDRDLWEGNVGKTLLLSAESNQRAKEEATETGEGVRDELLHTLFTRQVEQNREQLAIVSPWKQLTYGELHQQAQIVAQELGHCGLEPNQLIAVVMEKGWEQVVAVLGILYSGAAYVPIAPDLPTERRRHLLQQIDAVIVLTQEHLEESLEWPAHIQCLVIAEEGSTIKVTTPTPAPIAQSKISQITADKDRQPEELTPEDLAYVIYTSGSTGQPKGVMINHRGAVNTILDINRRFAVNREDRVLALSALNFDLSVYDIFGTLAAGATIVLPVAERAQDPAHWLTLLEQYQVSIWNSVPALMQMLVDYIGHKTPSLPPSLRLIMMSGDWIPLSLPPQIRSLCPTAQLVSLGGATEASIWSIYYPIGEVAPQWKSIPYGKPLSNQSFYVLNHFLAPCPTWVTGELYIGGLGLALGYWKDPIKTQNSFVVDPHSGELLYRTGDLGRYLPDGNIEFLGREDSQVKINGYRIELGEIEAALEQHPLVKNAVVATNTEKQLVAYVVPKVQENGHQSPQDLASLSRDAIELNSLENIIVDPLERIEFKLQQSGLRPVNGGEVTVELVKPELDRVLTETYLKRQSHRQFSPDLIPFDEFSLFLSCQMQIKLDNIPLPKYRYPSAGNLYPVQIYLLIKPNRVEGLGGGIYYYNPAEHRLILLNPIGEEVDGLGANVYGATNQVVFEGSAFSLFLLGKMDAISPMYAELGREFCLLEAGYLSQLLMEKAADYQLGLCPIGYLNFEGIRSLFRGLSSTHTLLHSFVGGKIDSTLVSRRQQPETFASVDNLNHGTSLRMEQINTYLRQRLPEYMVPIHYLLLNSLPLNANGKIDRKSLPLAESIALTTQRDFVAPSTPTEKAIATVCIEVLQREKISVNDNLLLLGGDSLQATQIIVRLRDIFEVELPLQKFWEQPTISSLAEYIDTTLWVISGSQINDQSNPEREEGKL